MEYINEGNGSIQVNSIMEQAASLIRRKKEAKERLDQQRAIRRQIEDTTMISSRILVKMEKMSLYRR